jgi:transcriptional regulator with XRE-family HTH domain
VAIDPKAVDAHVGSRVRLRRTLLGFSQEKLGEAVGLTFQQIQKYERGANRIGSSRLFQFSQVLDVPVSFFFDDMPEAAGARPGGMSEDAPSAYESNQFTKRETLELVRAYYKITNPDVRKRVFELVKAVAGVKRLPRGL